MTTDKPIGFGQAVAMPTNVKVISVSTQSQFAKAITSTTPTIVEVTGEIKIGYQLIHSNVAIVGIGSNAKLIGTVRIEPSKNVLLYNLTITNNCTKDTDGISIAHSSNVWVHHCSIYDCGDGMLDITKGSTNVTVSWCKFWYTKPWEHALACLIGADSKATSDRGLLHCTFHHNWFGQNCDDRMPRVRFGRVHCFNNYYHSKIGTDKKVSACITSAIEAEVLVENNYVESGEDPFYKYPGENGKIKTVGNYVAPAVQNVNLYKDIIFAPSYSYTLTPVMDVKSVVMAGAGVH